MRLASLIGPELKQILKEDPDQVRALFDEIHAEDLAACLAGRERADTETRWAELVPAYQNLAANIA